ncbi:S-phase kinase-associated protein 2-like [Babylonia areolata]|uniref:S-phase kinase-associated protein 2-like n=1 Tax=Babylonia areolata TaxID=304850 RepID=UPI003FD0B8F7
MNMGKAKGSKKWAKEVRKENRPYHGERTNALQHLPGPSHSRYVVECRLADSSEEEAGLVSSSDDLPLASCPSWTLNSNSVTSDEYGVVPLPTEDKGSVVVSKASNDRPEAVPLRTLSGNKQYLVTPALPTRAAPAAPMAPRVLGNRQRENCFQNMPDEDSMASFFGLLTPPRKDDLCHIPRIPEVPDYFEHVPDEVILHIFYFLTRRNLVRCMRVCKKWSRIACDELLWRRVDIGHRKVHSKTVGLLFNRGTTHLRLAKSEIKGNLIGNLNNSFSEEPSASRLQYLDLSMATISEKALADILSHCRQLRKVSLEHVGVNETILHLLSENPKLDTLNLAMSRGVTSSGLMPLFAHCSKLTQLNLAWTGMAQKTVSYVCGAVPENILHLNISGCREVISDEDVERLCSRCKSLVELDLSDSLGLSGMAVASICTHLAHVQQLSLNRCYNIPPTYFHELGSMPSLQMLNVIGMLARGFFENLKQELPKIQLNTTLISTIARPTTGQRRTSIWEQRVRE